MLNDELQNFFAIDADTVRAEGQDERIRLVGFDAPETRKPWKGQNTQPAADLATEETRSALEQGATIVPVGGRDATGTRSMGRMIRADGEEHSEYMIRNGLASPTQWSTQSEMDQELAGFFRRNALPEMMTADEQELAVRRDEALSIPAEFDLAGNIKSAGQPGGTVKRSWDRGVDNMQAMLYAFGNAVGDQLGAEGWAEDARHGLERNMMEAAINPAKVADWDAVTWGNVGTYALEAIFENLPNMGASLGAGLVVAASGGTTAPGVATAGVAARQAAGKAAMRFALGSGAASYGLNSGEVQKELLEAGIDASGTALVAGIPMAALDAIGLSAIAAPLLKTSSKTAALQILEASGAKLWKEAAKGLGKGAAIGATVEAPTEALQELILLTARAYEDPSFELFSEENLKRVREAAIKGGIAGAATSGVISAGTDSFQQSRNQGLAQQAGVTPDMTEAQAETALQQWRDGQAAQAQTQAQGTQTQAQGTQTQAPGAELTDPALWRQAYPQGDIQPVADYRKAEGWDETRFSVLSSAANKAAYGVTQGLKALQDPTLGETAARGQRIGTAAAARAAYARARDALAMIEAVAPNAETQETSRLREIMARQEVVLAELGQADPESVHRDLIQVTAAAASQPGSTTEGTREAIERALGLATRQELSAFISNQVRRAEKATAEAEAQERAGNFFGASTLQKKSETLYAEADRAQARLAELESQGLDAPEGRDPWTPLARVAQIEVPEPTSSIQTERQAPSAETQSLTPPTQLQETTNGLQTQAQGRRQENADVTNAPHQTTTESQTLAPLVQAGEPLPAGVGSEDSGVAPAPTGGLGMAPTPEGAAAPPVLPATEATPASPGARAEDGAPGAEIQAPGPESEVLNAETQGVAPPATTENREPGDQATALGATATNESAESTPPTPAPVDEPAGDAVGAEPVTPEVTPPAELHALSRSLLSPAVKKGATTETPIKKGSFPARWSKLPVEVQDEARTLTGETEPARIYDALANHYSPSEDTAKALGAENRAPDSGQPDLESVEPVGKQRQPEGAPNAEPENVEEALIDTVLGIQDPATRAEAVKILSEVYQSETQDVAEEGASAVEKGLRLESLTRKEAQVKRGEIADLTEQEWDDLYTLPTLMQREFDSSEAAQQAIRGAYERVKGLVNPSTKTPEPSAPVPPLAPTWKDVGKALSTLPKGAPTTRLSELMQQGSPVEAMAEIERLQVVRQAPSATPEPQAPSATTSGRSPSATFEAQVQGASARPRVMPMSYQAAPEQLRAEVRDSYPGETAVPLTRLIADGKRTATTRNPQPANAPAYAVGQRLRFPDVPGEYEITEIRNIDFDSPEGRRAWSELEGWDADAIDRDPKLRAQVRSPRSKQIVFKRVDVPQAPSAEPVAQAPSAEPVAQAPSAMPIAQAPSAEPETQAPSTETEAADPFAELARSGQIEDPRALIEVLAQDLDGAFREFMIDPKSAGAVTRLLEAARNAGYARAGLEPPQATHARTLQVETPEVRVQPPSAEEAPTAAAAGAESLATEIEGFEATFEELLREHQAEHEAVLENEAHAAQDETFEERLSRERAEIERAYLEGTYPPKPVSLVVNVKPDGVKADGLMADAGVVVLIGRVLQTVAAEAGLKAQVSLARGAERQTVALDDFTWDLVNKDGWSMIDVRLEGLVEPDQTVLSDNPQAALEKLASIFASGANSPNNKVMLPVGALPGVNHKQVAVNTVSIRRFGRQLRGDQRVLSDETVEQAYLRDFFEGLTTLTELLGTTFKGVLSGDMVVEQKDGARVTLKELLTSLNDEAVLYQSYVDAQRAASEALDDYLYHAGALEAEIDALWREIEAAQQGAELPVQARRELARIDQERAALESQREQMVREKRGKDYAARWRDLNDRVAALYRERALDGPTRGRLKELHEKRRRLVEQVRPHLDRSKLHNGLARELRAELEERRMLPTEAIEDLDSRGLARSANREKVTLKEWRQVDRDLEVAEAELAQARQALANASRREAVQAKRDVMQAERGVNAARQARRDLAERERSYRELVTATDRAVTREDQEVEGALERGTYEPELETEERQAQRSAHDGQHQARRAERQTPERGVEITITPKLTGQTHVERRAGHRVSAILDQVLRATGLRQDSATDVQVTIVDQASLDTVLDQLVALGRELSAAIEAIKVGLGDPQQKREHGRLKRMLAERQQDLAEARNTYKLLRDTRGMANPARVIYNNGYATPSLRQPIVVLNERASGRHSLLDTVRSIAHEIGHIVQQVYLNRMSPEVRVALARAFQADRPFGGAPEEVLRAGPFAEWFAEQAVAYAARQAPQHESALAQFFQDVVDALRAAWRALRAQTQLNETFRQFLDAVNGYYGAQGEYRGTRFQNQVVESLAASGRSPFLAQRREGEAPFDNMAPGEAPGQHDWNFLQRRRLDRLREGINQALDSWNGSPTKASLVNFSQWMARNTVQPLASWFDARGPIMKELGAHFYRRTDARGNNLGRGAPWETRIRQDFAHVWSTLMEPALTPLRREAGLVNKVLQSDPGLDLRSDLYAAVHQALIRETPLNSIPDPETRATVDRLRKALEATRQFLNDEYGLNIDKRDNYWPVVVDMVRFQRDKEVVIQKLRTELGLDIMEAEEVWEDTMNSEGSIVELIDGQLVSEHSKVVTPGFEWGRSRRWTPDIHRVLREWQVEDIGGTLHRYASAAVKRGVTQKMFGLEVEVHRRDGTVERRMDPISKLNVMLAKARQTGELSEAEYKFATEMAIPALFGQLGLDGNPEWRALSSWAVTYQNLRLLSFVVFSSFVDPALILNRGDARSTWNGLRAMIRARGIEEAKAELKALGALRSDMTEAIVNDQLGGMYMGGTPQRINEAFFRAVQMHRWTNMTRAWALGAGKTYLSDHARNAQRSAPSRQRLRVLGVTPEQVMAWEAAGKRVGDRRFPEINAALNQFLDDSVLRPHAALRAAWASDPRLMMFAHLKSFAWTFYERALRQVWTESVRRWGDEVGPRKALALMPVVTLAVPALALAAVGYELRRKIGWWNEVPAHMEKDGLEYVWELSQRAGFYGPLQFVMDAERGADQGNRVWLLSLLGPQVDQIQDVLGNGVEKLDKSFWRALPGLQQFPAARQWFDREVW